MLILFIVKLQRIFHCFPLLFKHTWYGRDMQHFTEADCVGHLPEMKFLPGHLDVERQKPPIPRQGSSLYESAK